MDVGLINHLEYAVDSYYLNRIVPCGKKFWTNYYGSSIMPKVFRFLNCWHKVKCGDIYFEGKALCDECKKSKRLRRE